MENTNKILIIVVIVLVGVLGIVGGYLLQGYLVNNNNNSTNQSNASVNNTNNTTQSSSESNNKSEFLSEGEAIGIARANVQISEEYNVGAKFIPDQGKEFPAHWIIAFVSVKTGKSIVGVTLDARTGAILGINYD